MSDIKNRLQFVHSDKLFKDSAEAKKYVNDLISTGKRPSLYAEPMVLKYGDEENPNILLAIGSVGDGKNTENKNKVFFIDCAQLDFDNNFQFVDTNTVTFEIEENEKGPVVKSNVVTKSEKKFGDKNYKNVILNDEDGLFTHFNTFVENDQIVVNVNGDVKKYDLPDPIEKGLYDKDNLKLTLLTKKNNGVVIDFNDVVTVSADDDNIVKKTSQGLIATVNLSYDSETNKLSLLTSNDKQVDVVLNSKRFEKFEKDQNIINVNVDTRVDQLYNLVEELNGGVDELGGGLNDLSNGLKECNEQLVSANTTIGECKTTIGECKTTVDNFKNSINDLEIFKTSAQKDINALSGTVKTKTLFSEDTDTTHNDITVTDNGTILETNVKISNTVGNIIQVADDGLYALESKNDEYMLDYNKTNNILSLKKNEDVVKEITLTSSKQEEYYNNLEELSGNVVNISNVVDNISSDVKNINLEYNQAYNKLTFTTSNGSEKEITLSEHTLVQSGYYDNTTQEIVLIIDTDSGTDEIRIKVEELYNIINVEKVSGSVVWLENNNNTLSAKINIDNNENCLLTVREGDGNSLPILTTKEIKVNWYSNDSTIPTQIPLQSAISNLQEGVGGVSGGNLELNNKVSELEEKVDGLEQEITTLNGENASLSSRVNDLEQEITTLNGENTSLSSRVNDLEAQLQVLTDRLDGINFESLGGLTNSNIITEDGNLDFGTTN